MLKQLFDALFIGFTGTSLLKKNKQKSIEILSAAALNRMLERPVGLSAKAGNRGKSQDQGDSASPDAKRNSNGANSIASFLQLAAV